MAEYPRPTEPPRSEISEPESETWQYGAGAEYGTTREYGAALGGGGLRTERDVGGGTDAGGVKEKAAQTAQSAADAGGQVAQTAVGQAKNVAAEATSQARDLAGEARGQLRDQARQQQERAVSGLRSLGDEFDSMASGSDRSGVATEMVRQASQRTHSVADWLSDRKPGDLIQELRRFARRRPGTFLLGAAVAGVVAGRLTRGVTSASSDSSTVSEPPAVRGAPLPASAPASEAWTSPTPLGDQPPVEFGDPGGAPVSSYPPAGAPGTSYPPGSTQERL